MSPRVGQKNPDRGRFHLRRDLGLPGLTRTAALGSDR
jgi:hypothetical protein